MALNPDLSLSLDVQLFERDPLSALDLYRGDFLEGFYVRMMKTLISGLLANEMLIGSSMSKVAIKKIEQVGFADPSIELLLHHLVELDEFEEKKLPALDGVL